MHRTVQRLGMVGVSVCLLVLVGCGGDGGGGSGAAGTGDTAGTSAVDGGSENAGTSAAGTSAAGTGGAGAGGAGASGSGAGSGAQDAGVDGAMDEDAGDMMVAQDAGTDAALPMGVTMAAETSCKDRCDLQEALVGSGGGCPSVSLVTTCKTECTTSGEQTLSDCSDEFKAYYDCSITDGYRCVLGKVAQKTTGCADEKATLDSCNAQ